MVTTSYELRIVNLMLKFVSVCDVEICEKKLSKVIVPDKWKEGASNTTEGGGRKINENKLLSKKNRGDCVTLQPVKTVLRSKKASNEIMLGTVLQKNLAKPETNHRPQHVLAAIVEETEEEGAVEEVGAAVAVSEEAPRRFWDLHS
ncbi:hypothetical protein RJT34_17977 [Clitoria ternatea]|uniref:Cysteine-rich PDZ-binding protein n=1 Tax=Clitoria ternatea TaxID=43366 RepID=A0AAN9JD21_CLITE